MTDRMTVSPSMQSMAFSTPLVKFMPETGSLCRPESRSVAGVMQLEDRCRKVVQEMAGTPVSCCCTACLAMWMSGRPLR